MAVQGALRVGLANISLCRVSSSGGVDQYVKRSADGQSKRSTRKRAFLGSMAGFFLWRPYRINTAAVISSVSTSKTSQIVDVPLDHGQNVQALRARTT